MRRSIHLPLLLSFFASLLSCGGGDPVPVPSKPVAEVTLDKTVVNCLAMGPAVHVNAEASGPLTWTSSDASIATADDGWIFGKKAGTATITVALASGDAQAKLTVNVSPATDPTDPGAITTFVKRQGARLVEGDQTFRFISFNVPNLHVVEDPSWRQTLLNPAGSTPDFWHRVDPWEQEDAVQSVAQMGGTVIRVYCFSIQGGRNNAQGPSHYTGPQDPLNEDMMQDYDHMIAICKAHGVRLIIPFIDEWDWFGGRAEFAALSGGGDFYTNAQVIADFKAMIQQILTRVNTVTQVAYKDDPTILAWETGNELQSVPQGWTSDIAAFIKGIAPDQLVMDGAAGSIVSLADPNVDILTNHYYEGGGKDYVARALADQDRIGGTKPFLVGEFGCTTLSVILDTLDTVIADGSCGALIWSLRFHAKDGGFYWHNDGSVNAYHWPGFASNAVSDEIHVLTELRNKAWTIRGFQTPDRPGPGAPELLATSTTSSIAWKGSVGAEYYALERSTDQIQWTQIATSLSDAGNPFQPYSDTGLISGNTYYYRMRAVNPTGASDPSAILALQAP